MRPKQVKQIRHNRETLRIVKYPNGDFAWQTSCSESLKTFSTLEDAVSDAKASSDKTLEKFKKRIVAL